MKYGRITKYNSINDFKSLDEIALYLGCKFKKQEKSEIEGIQYDIYFELPEDIVNNKKDSKNFFENLIQYTAKVLEYKNFIIKDEKNSTSILVKCREQDKIIETYAIDNVFNYFDKAENEKNISEFKKVESIDIKITSEILKKAILNKWQTSGIDLGTAESTYKNYNIYFDEGYQIKFVNGKIFNIIFTEKYPENVVSNLKVNSSTKEILETLGTPQFQKGDLIGYKGKNIYVFFYKDQISVYRVENNKADDIAEIIEKYSKDKNSKDLIDQMRILWNDYDIFENDVNYDKLQYTLKGLSIKFDSTTKKGIILYNNYEGNICGNIGLQELIETKQNLPENVYIENEDLVFVTENNRINKLEDVTPNNNYSTSIIVNTSNKFKTHISQTKKGSEMYKVRFISINNEYPNSELRESISSGIWYNDEILIYSVSNRGIYTYNARTRTYSTITTGKETYKLKKIRDNILFYDENAIEFSL